MEQLDADALFGFGFTEAAGNFQQDNFGRGGWGGDAVQAEQQIDPQLYGQEIHDEFRTLSSVAAGNGNLPFFIPQSVWAQVPDSNPVAHFLFDGIKRGSGKLVATIYKSDHVTKIADGPAIHLKLLDVKEMYERWTVDPAADENSSGGIPAASWRISTARGLSGFRYGPTSPEENKYILLVHGWNMTAFDKDWFAETAFKRLYWQGYKGRFGAFQWPATYHGGGLLSIAAGYDFDPSEYTSWRSAPLLAGLLVQLNARYSDHVYMFAHSQGNVVAGEALRLAAQDGLGPIVNTYVATQAAIPVHCYDPAQPLPADFFNSWRSAGGAPVYAAGPSTPNVYPNWLAGNNAAAPNRVNFFNVNDFALARGLWETDQAMKPNITGPHVPYGYAGDPEAAPVEDGFTQNFGLSRMHLGDAANIRDRYEIMAFAAEPRCRALGATANAAGFDSRNLGDLDPVTRIWPPDPFQGNDYHTHPWHSAQFRFSNMEQNLYWQELMFQFGLPTITNP